MVSSANDPKPLTHIGADGEARMVDVSDKAATDRIAIAEGRVRMSASTLRTILAGDAKKGDVIGAARIAGIMAAKKTSDLIPLCHPVGLTKVSVDIAPDDALPGLIVRAEARCVGQTGVEMEALTAVSVACLTIYDMAKAIDRGMSIEAVRLIEKRGGKSGEWRAATERKDTSMSPMITVDGGWRACSPPPRRRSTRKRWLLKRLMAGCSRATLKRCAPSRRFPIPPWTARAALGG